jgi:hypothetical protein
MYMYSTHQEKTTIIIQKQLLTSGLFRLCHQPAGREMVKLQK